MENKKRASVIKTIFTSFKLVVQSGGAKYLVFTAIMLVAGVFTSFNAVFQRNFINDAAEIIEGNHSAIRTAAFWLALWGCVELTVLFVGILTNRMDRKLWQKVEYYVQSEVLEKVSKIKLAYFDNTDTHRILDYLKSNLGSRVSYVINGMLNIMYSTVQFITVGIIIFNENKWIALIIIVSAIPSVIIRHLQTEENYWEEQKNSHEVRFQFYVSWLLCRKKYVKEMQFYDLYDYMYKRFDQSIEARQGKQIKLMKKYTLVNGLASLINYAAIGISLIIIVLDIYNKKTGIGSFVLVYTSASNLQAAVSNVFSRLMEIGNEGRFIEEYYTVMNYDEEKYEINPQKNIADGLYIEFRNVSFAYPQTENVVLKNISLKINQGEKIAIIGENGSGKSTFIALLTGLYEPIKGEILVNGINIADNLGILRDNLSCTYQNFVHYDMTVEENIRLGDLANEHSFEDVAVAAKKAGIYDEIMALPDKFDTPLGNYAENGRELSGGQWQKLAMARNLIKDSAKIMILDEPTAALDPVAESELYREFQNLTEDKTVLLISHRLGATRLAERILVFSEGQIVEDGSHEELLKKGGLYNRMYNAQAQWYV